MEYLKRVSVLLALVFLSLGLYLGYWMNSVQSAEVIFTTDGHGHILPSRLRDGTEIGGLSALGSFLKDKKGPYLLVDSGDIYQGAPEGTLTKGSIVVELMNLLGYDALAVGNHEFDHGVENLRELSRMAEFPFLGLNIIQKDTGRPPDFISPGFIADINSVRIGISGVTYQNMENVAVKEHIEGLEFISGSEPAARELASLREEGAEITLLLSHRGLEEDLRDARYLKEADLILSGHSHRLLKKPEVVKRTIVCQAGSNFTHAGQLILFYSSSEKRIISYSHSMIPLDTGRYGPYPPAEEIIDREIADLKEEMDRVIGESKLRLSRVLRGEYQKHGELALGNLQADIMRETTGSDLAFQNTGGIRGDIPRGEIRVRDIWELSPFGNSIVTMDLTGSQIKELLELSASHRYSKLQVSGLEMIYNDTLPEGSRVLNIFIINEEGEKEDLDYEQYYRVATNSFLAQGGDGYQTFKEGEDTEDTSIILREAQIEYISQNSPVTASAQGRLMNVSLQ